MTASWKRLLLAWFLDFEIFFAAVALFHFLTGGVFDGWFLVEITLFGTLRFLVSRVMATPGQLLLGIDDEAYVDPDIKSGENWVTIVLGVLFFCTGLERVVRWTTDTYPLPHFGFLADGVAEAGVEIAVGVAMLVTGWSILRLYRWGFWLGVGMGAGGLVSTVLSLRAWSDLMPMIVAMHRAAQGLPVRPGAVDFMRIVFPSVVLATLCVTLLALLMARPRLSREV